MGIGTTKVATSNMTTIFPRRSGRRCQRIYIKTFFAGKPELPPSKLFVPSKWSPNNYEIPMEVRLRVNDFIQQTGSLFRQRPTVSNLLPGQAATLLSLAKSTELHVLKTDKNLSPAIIERPEYIRRAFLDHLSETRTDCQLSKGEMLSFIDRINYLLATFENNFFFFSSSKIESFDQIHPHLFVSFTYTRTRTIQRQASPLGQFYLLAKIHKTPWKTRLIISCSGSLLHGLGRWVDGELQHIFSLLPYVLRSSTSLVSDLMALRSIHPSTQFLTCDATSMYTN
jgi:hypothetical protein